MSTIVSSFVWCVYHHGSPYTSSKEGLLLAVGVQ